MNRFVWKLSGPVLAQCTLIACIAMPSGNEGQTTSLALTPASPAPQIELRIEESPLPTDAMTGATPTATRMPIEMTLPALATQQAPTIVAGQTLAAQMQAGQPTGRIVFTCFIDGSDEICVMDADGLNQQQLTFEPTTDWYADFSPDGDQIVFSSQRDSDFEIYIMDIAGGQPHRLTQDIGDTYAPSLSPDGGRIVFSAHDGVHSDIWVMDVDGSNPTQLTRDVGNNIDPVWSPDGTQIVFASDRNRASTELYVMDKDGTDVRQLTFGAKVGGRSDWSPDGSQVAFYAGSGYDRDIFVVNADGSSLQRLPGSGNDKAPSFSPDGQWLAFASPIDGDNEIFIMRIDGSDLRQLTFNERPDWQPRWGP